MKSVRDVIAVLLLVSLVQAGNEIWSEGTARTLPAGRREVGIFSPWRYGKNDRMEIATHRIANILIPNVRFKLSWPRSDGWFLASRHSFVYPTPLLRVISREGTGGIISPEFNVPWILVTRQEVLVTREFERRSLFTAKAGLALALLGGKLDSRTSIDLPVIFPRMVVYYNSWGINLGVDISRPINQKLYYLIDFDLHISPGAEESVALEHKGLLLWRKHDLFSIMVGYKLTYGEYPFGTQAHLFPVLDLVWAKQH
ncbi:MAG: hypothetical protein ACE5EE_04980 [Fidelibacterota bacterium]